MTGYDAGDSITANLGSWSFSDGVESKFDQHVRKSVPGYDMSHQIVKLLSDPFIRKSSRVLDLGCSTGTLSRLLYDRHKDKRPQIIAIDNQDNMINYARNLNEDRDIEYYCQDLTDSTLPVECDLVASFYTLQFIPPSHRQCVVNEIYNALNWGGGFFLFEKVRAPDARFQDYISHGFTNFKLESFNPTEVIGKANSLVGVMEPFSTQGNVEMLKRAGFVDITSVFKILCFEGFLAIK